MERAEVEAPIPDAEAKPLGLSRFLDGSFAASAQIPLPPSLDPAPLYPFRELPKKGAGVVRSLLGDSPGCHRGKRGRAGG